MNTERRPGSESHPIHAAADGTGTEADGSEEVVMSSEILYELRQTNKRLRWILAILLVFLGGPVLVWGTLMVLELSDADLGTLVVVLAIAALGFLFLKSMNQPDDGADT